MPSPLNPAMLDLMTTMTDQPRPSGPDDPQPPKSTPQRRLRRSNTDRVAAGVSGGLGEYFGIDPVLFRVLFAVTSFFGGAGVIAYLLAWLLIPDHDTVQAPMDLVARWMRRHRVPFWLVATIVVIIGWGSFFSWWAPRGPTFVVVVAIVILAVVIARRSRGPAGPTGAVTTPTSEPTLTSEPIGDGQSAAEAAGPVAPYVPYVSETRAWIQQSRERRRRTAPVRWATLGVLAATLGGLAIADSVGGIVLPVYFWVGGSIVLAGLLTGLALRRTPWGLTVLLVPAILGLIAFGGTRASLHDGLGRTVSAPASVAGLDSDYRLAFGELTLDLRSISPLSSPRTIDITVAGGQVRLLLPKTLNASVQANVHLGDLRVDDRGDDHGPNDSDGANFDRVVAAPTGATGAPLTIRVHLAAGDVRIEHS
jgi:phage shock protein PspC (stress-responsive transcriptional regulator)